MKFPTTCSCIQSWTVVRTPTDYQVLYDSLRPFLPSLPPPPPVPPPSDPLLPHAHSHSAYLDTLLQTPGVRESPPLRRFLCDSANSIPERFADSLWKEVEGVEEMEMDDMFEVGASGQVSEAYFTLDNCMIDKLTPHTPPSSLLF